MLSFAQKKEIEEKAFPLWLANYAISKFQGLEAMEYSEFIEGLNLDTEIKDVSKKKERTAEEILAEFEPVIHAARAARREK